MRKTTASNPQHQTRNSTEGYSFGCAIYKQAKQRQVVNKSARKIKGEPPTQWHRPLHGVQSQSARQRKWAPTVYRWLWSSPAADHSYPVCTSTALGEKKVKNREKEYMKKCFSNCQKFILGKASAPSGLFEHTQKKTNNHDLILVLINETKIF